MNINNNLQKSLTYEVNAHWITEDFKVQQAVLQGQSFEASHTGEQICKRLENIFLSWNIHLVVCDNGANIGNALNEAGNTRCVLFCCCFFNLLAVWC